MFNACDQGELPADEAPADRDVAAALPPHPQSSRLAVAQRLAAWRGRIEARCEKIDLAPDLADNIGTRRWFRGLGTFIGLGIAAISCWPDFTAVEAATALPIENTTRSEYRSQMIMPLVMGGESGKRMGGTAAVIPLASVPERPTISFTATLAQGDSLGVMLQRSGVSAGDAAQASQLIASAVSLGEIGPGTRLELTLGRRAEGGTQRPLDALKFRARFDLDLAVERRGGHLALEQRAIIVDATPLRITGTVGPSLYRSARAAGAPMKAIQQYLQTMDQHLSLEGDSAPTDQFDMVLSYRRSARGESAAGELLYAGIERDGKPRAELLRWGKDGQFFEVSGMGRQVASTQFAPVAGHITSYFGMRRHPILGYVRMHGGVDYGARWGSPIYAASAGVVSFAGRHGGHGNYVRIEHGGGLGTGYAHMSSIAVSPGTSVQAGQVIGYVGSTGLSTGPHLHFEAYRGGQKINPLLLSFASQVTVDKKEVSAFNARLAQLKAVTPGAALASIAPRQAAVAPE